MHPDFAGCESVRSVLLSQIYFTFLQALWLVAVIAFLVGLGVGAVAAVGLSKFGAAEKLGQVWTGVVFRELAPLLVSFLVIARSGTAVAAETATMKANREIEALEMMGIPAFEFVFSPRILAGSISSFCLATVFMGLSFLGTWLVGDSLTSIPLSDFFYSAYQAFTWDDPLFFFAKTALVGGGAFAIACSKGLSLRKATFEVPIMTTKAVVHGMGWVLLAHGVLSVFYFSQHGWVM